MSFSEGHKPNENETGPSGERSVTSAKSGGGRKVRNVLRFGLLELLLITAAIAVWLPALLAFRTIPGLVTDIQVMRKATMDLLVEDPTQLTIRALPSVWQKMEVWKYYAPPEAALELRMGTEGMSACALPLDYEAVSLPAGKHLIQLKSTRDETGFHKTVYIDGEILLEKHHPNSWLNYGSSSSTTDLEGTSQTFPLTEVVKLRDERALPNNPIAKGGYRVVQLEGDQDHKGLALWISPSDLEVEAAPHFIARPRRVQEWTIGIRNGARVRSSTEKDAIGLLDIAPAVDSVLGEPRLHKETRFGVSVRPIVDLGSDAEIPELQLKGKTDAVSIPLALHVDPTLPKQNPAKMTARLWSKRAISDDGTKMRVFAHYERFPSGAQPIVEILFDSDHPRRIGFLPRSAPGSTPMQACEFVTRFDSRFFWRKVVLELDEKTGNENADSVPQDTTLEQLSANFNKLRQEHASSEGVGAMPWLEVPFNRLPWGLSPSDAYRVRKLSLRTDVSNVTKVSFPNGLVPRWEYQGIPNQQVWWLPAAQENEDAESNIKVEILPTTFFPTTKLALPGGPAFGNVRITVPMPATKPIWLAIEPDNELLSAELAAQ